MDTNGQKKLSDFLPLYLGQNAKVIQYDLFEYKNELSLGDTLPISLESLSQIQKGNLKLIPILRPLSSMTEDEKLELYTMGFTHNKGMQILHPSEWKSFTPEQFIKLRKWGFDIFRLKEKGLCLYPEDL